jgi:hypothetical protein
LSSEGPPPQLPDVEDILVSTAASLVNLAAIRLTEEEHRNPAKAKDAIEAARRLLPLCPEEAAGPVRDALSQIQMLYVKEQRGGAQPDEPRPSESEGRAKAEDEERAKARSRIWTPPGA